MNDTTNETELASNKCSNCENDLTKEYAKFIFAYHCRDSKILHGNPSDMDFMLMCICGLVIGQDGSEINSRYKLIE